MANFLKSLGYTLQNEGGFIDDPDDAGGATNKGITREIYSQYSGHTVSVDDLKNISDEDLEGVYNKFFWLPIHGNEINDDGIATAIFDMAVNMGPHEAVYLAQDVLLMDMGLGPVNPWGVMLDGSIGPKTLSGLNEVKPEIFITFYAHVIEQHYREICAKDIIKIKFLGGWVKRAERLLSLRPPSDKP